MASSNPQQPAAPAPGQQNPNQTGDMLKSLGALIMLHHSGKSNPEEGKKVARSAERRAQGAAKAGADAAQIAGQDAAQGNDLAALSQAQAAQGQAAQDQAVADAQLPEQQAMLKRLDEMDRSFAAAHEATQKQVNAARDQYLGTIQDLKGAHVYSWYDNAGTGAKALAFISQALAGALQGGFGMQGPTPMDKIIDQNLTQQKLALSQKSEAASAAGGLYRSLLDQFKDEVVAEGAFRSIAYNSFQERLKAQAATMAGGQVKANLQTAIAKINEAWAKNNAEIDKYLGDKAQAQGALSAGLSQNWASQWLDADRTSQTVGAKGGLMPGLADVQGSQFLSPDAQSQLGAVLTGGKGTIASSNEIVRILDSKGPVADKRRQLDQAINSTLEQFKELAKLGQLSQSDISLAEKAVGIEGGFTGYLTGGTDAQKLQRVQKFQSFVRTLMNKAVESRAVFDSSGNSVPLKYTGKD